MIPRWRATHDGFGEFESHSLLFPSADGWTCRFRVSFSCLRPSLFREEKKSTKNICYPDIPVRTSQYPSMERTKTAERLLLERHEKHTDCHSAISIESMLCETLNCLAFLFECFLFFLEVFSLPEYCTGPKILV